MRIIGGRLKGRTLRGPPTAATRPTSDRLRETLFNVLEHSYGDPVADAAVLDLFAGTGALACEALSRGAQRALLIEEARAPIAVIQANLESLGLSDRARVVRRDIRRLGPAMTKETPFTLAFLDPPYGKRLAEPALEALAKGEWLAQDALTVIEESSEATLLLPSAFVHVETRIYGETKLVFTRYSKSP
ncbi:16S rRNA (guanine(966)-N(2))-methyltransferase RsmD [Beijerinckia mobilis]|uniref:16S rRNA (guanine(966)-N(2))-methyltransferase RsmD n=1 Tax=Beijerinckia mobilis TaxID=231434 RepID=UPI00054D39C2|nr:16S rRNA (guanine(966)-N(2))-methyltransferase RsmD [Beijerinckia mobilis]